VIQIAGKAAGPVTAALLVVSRPAPVVWGTGLAQVYIWWLWSTVSMSANVPCEAHLRPPHNKDGQQGRPTRFAGTSKIVRAWRRRWVHWRLLEPASWFDMMFSKRTKVATWSW